MHCGETLRSIKEKHDPIPPCKNPSAEEPVTLNTFVKNQNNDPRKNKHAEVCSSAFASNRDVLTMVMQSFRLLYLYMQSIFR
jgi:hypothetical protein